MTRAFWQARDFHNDFARLVVCLGLIVMIGWYTGLERVVQVHPSFAPMQYNTALGFVISGLGAFCMLRFHRSVGAVLGLVVLGLGVASLLQYAFNVNFGIDELLMQGSINVRTSHPGRMSPQTAICFTLAGAALVTLGLVKAPKLRTLTVELICPLFGALGLAATIGYLAGIEPLYGWTELTRMALHTAVGFTVLALVLLQTAWRLDAVEGPRLLAFPVGIGALVVALALFRMLIGWQAERVYDSPLPVLVLVIGLLASALLALTVHLAQVSLRRTRDLAQANEELSASQGKLEHLALFDDVTGLGNRNLFMQQLEHVVNVARRKSETLPLLVIDLDGFKQVNDTFGHKAGDTVLREFGTLLKKVLRSADQAFRIGGDEFAVLLHSGTALDGAMNVAHRIEKGTKTPLERAGQARIAGASIGIAIYPEHGQECDRLLRNADGAMYEAKHSSTKIQVASDAGATAVLAALKVKREPPRGRSR